MLKGNKKVPPPGIEHGLPSRQNNQRPGGGYWKVFWSENETLHCPWILWVVVVTEWFV